ncbi:endonuclease domain-containing protein [Thermithiobacillus tepidarius DSM 3134]|uniref:endonuclease domain-containing protein n=1 Tax=Thermithiobacillus tepidarius TaxID=929 RepID=UPI0003F5A14E|nr:endonuclease domain-containing protein [Thermithiobacillus tepidarius]
MKNSETTSIQFARELRQRQTDAESRFWRHLRSRQLDGLKFRRLHPVGPYVLDFYCHEARLCVELDGGQHYLEAGARRDGARRRFLEAQGIRTLRFGNLDVLQNMDGVLSAILATALTPARSPKERERGGANRSKPGPKTPQSARSQREGNKVTVEHAAAALTPPLSQRERELKRDCVESSSHGAHGNDRPGEPSPSGRGQGEGSEVSP